MSVKLNNSCKSIAIVVGEHSGDMLGAGILQHLQQVYPNAKFCGIGGQLMQKYNFTSFFPLERLCVMGFIEPLMRIFEIIKMQRFLIKYFIKERPDIFISIDSPDFCLPIAAKLTKNGITCVHYVSPTVWAWRPKRIFKIKRSVSHMLLLYPFESEIYKKHNISHTVVGHHLADRIVPQPLDKKQSRDKLAIDINAKVVALMPGSRKSVMKNLAPSFIETAEILGKNYSSEIIFVVACANKEREKEFINLAKNSEISFKTIVNEASCVLKASDSVLLASGTATLEAMFLRCPMVAAYKVSKLTYLIARMLIRVKHVAMPNILAGKEVVPEFLQTNINPVAMAAKIWQYLTDVNIKNDLFNTYEHLHADLKCNSNKTATEAIINLLK